MATPKKVVVLYSGGLDSTVVLAHNIHAGNTVLALSIDYGQSNRAELDQCRTLAGYWGFPHKVINVHMERTDARAEIPARNTVFLAKALEHALLIGADTVGYGAEPDATYTDSSPEYIEAMGRLMGLHGVKLEAPLRNLLGKQEVLTLALNLGVPLDLVHSSRTDRVDGGDRASGRFLKTLYATFPAINPMVLLQLLHSAHRTTNKNPFCIATIETGSFKYFPALLLLAASSYIEDADIYTTGNWGKSVVYVNNFLKRIGNPIVHRVDDVAQLKGQRFNTNDRSAVWGTKQALSRLPRPQYLDMSLSCRVTQGHLAAVLKDLGYTWAAAGIPLITEG